MIAIHRKYPTLRIGSIKLLLAGDNVLAYARFDDQAQIVTVVNNSDELQQVCIPVWQAELPQKGSMRRLIYSYENGAAVFFSFLREVQTACDFSQAAFICRAAASSSCLSERRRYQWFYSVWLS